LPATSLAQVTADAFRSAGDFAADLVNPTIRLGVTGLARSGKTVFITALVHNLIAAGRLPSTRRRVECRALISSRNRTTRCAI
jgi:predicted YcjX-like family ATPase